MKTVSLIFPCFNEQETLPELYPAVCAVIDRLPYRFELLFVDDGSTDRTPELLEQLYAQDKRVRYLSFSRNFGKEAALYAGLEKATGDFVAVMDADLQDPPDLLPEMLRTVDELGYDCAATRRVDRKGDPKIRSFFANCFYRLMRKISDTELMSGARDFRMMRRPMVDAVLSVSEYNRFSKGIFGWVGFRTKWLEYQNVERVGGKTKWSFWKLLRYAFEGITAFSSVPLSIASVMGLLFCLIAFLLICVTILRKWIWGDPVAGWPSLVCIVFFVGGIQLFCTGIIGQYLSKTYMESKRRPLYILKTDKTGEPRA